MRLRWVGLALLALAAVPLSLLHPRALVAHIPSTFGPLAQDGNSFHLSATRQTHAPLTSAHTMALAINPPAPNHWRGVIEGFYGPTWSNRATIHLLKFMSQHHLNTFVYAPKDNSYLRASWNQPFSQSALTHLAQLAVAARGLHINFVVSISPGLSIVYSNAADRAQLLMKINQLRSIGVQSFMLSFDDIPKTLDAADQAVYGNNLGLAQSSLANYVLKTETQLDSRFRMVFTPTVYWGDHANSYWDNLRQNLNPRVPVVWTGPGVLSPTITSQDAQAAAAALGHPLVVWDNYPVNDYSYVMYHRPQLFMGPLVGRSAGVVNRVQGYLMNPMLQPLASEVALWTAGAFLHNPTGYNPGQSWQHAIAAIGAKSPAAFKIFCEDSSASFLNPGASNTVSPAIAPFWQQYQAKKNLESTRLYHAFEAMSNVNTQLSQSLNPQLYQEIKPWAQQLSQEGAVGVSMIQIVEKRLVGDSTPASAINTTVASANKVVSASNTLGVTTVVNQWISQAKTLPPFAP